MRVARFAAGDDDGERRVLIDEAGLDDSDGWPVGTSIVAGLDDSGCTVFDTVAKLDADEKLRVDAPAELNDPTVPVADSVAELRDMVVPFEAELVGGSSWLGGT